MKKKLNGNTDRVLWKKKNRWRTASFRCWSTCRTDRRSTASCCARRRKSEAQPQLAPTARGQPPHMYQARWVTWGQKVRGVNKGTNTQPVHACYCYWYKDIFLSQRDACTPTHVFTVQIGMHDAWPQDGHTDGCMWESCFHRSKRLCLSFHAILLAYKPPYISLLSFFLPLPLTPCSFSL